MKVILTLKQDTLDIAAACGRQAAPEGTVLADSFDIASVSQSEAFDKAAILFATQWLNVEYRDDD